MLNHVHLLIEPDKPEEMPKIMHWINWYSAMSFNALLRRKGHFWEKRYTCHGFPVDDGERALNTLRYIHANPKAAGMQQGFFYDFSNYGVHDRLGDDGLTQWHPAFLSLGKTLDECAEKYREFCQKYRPKPKPETSNHWGSKLLQGMKITKKGKKAPKGQLSLWDDWEINDSEILEVADQFIFANCYNPTIAGDILQKKRSR